MICRPSIFLINGFAAMTSKNVALMRKTASDVAFNDVDWNNWLYRAVSRSNPRAQVRTIAYREDLSLKNGRAVSLVYRSNFGLTLLVLDNTGILLKSANDLALVSEPKRPMML